ncbi:MAG: Uma2 family endonuclease [Cyanobacteria bacterium P01_D01_bin.105]
MKQESPTTPVELAGERQKSYEEYLESDLGPDGNFRLLSNGEVIELPPEDEENYFIADELAELLKRLLKNRRLVKSNSTELQVHPVGDDRVNRVPDLIVLRPEHLKLILELKKNAVLLGMPAPLLVAEVISKGGERSANYRRDYEWKRQQYEWWGIAEYWIIDRHRQQVVIFTLKDGVYEESIYRGSENMKSSLFPSLELLAEQALTGEFINDD